MKKIICTVMCFVMFTTITTASAVYSVEHEDGNTYTEQDIDILQTYIKQQEAFKISANTMANSARELGFSEDSVVIQIAKERWETAHALSKSYQNIINQINAHWTAKEAEYPVATYIWRYLQNAGYNDYVCAGLLGNMMRESGGHTLNIQPYVYSSTRGYYGICQWSRSYGIHGASLDAQLALLVNTLPETMNSWGRLYRSGFNYAQFCNLQDAQQAALAFSKCYERGASYTHSSATRNAVKAYNYFMS